MSQVSIIINIFQMRKLRHIVVNFQLIKVGNEEPLYLNSLYFHL